ncbi:regulatory protein RecX [Microbacterium ureisolvens]|uniref:Regulatory protein RecX n=1 Tax=Microbacterium ureisolvens TaxID=2781186 RepID=A0ABS7HZ88_9MICO|nr:regulatory protein RecX [Microbacterium ureisolvens]MBW9109845.1 regulatory protein RecX [Microbacterium ureisolvens]
MVRFVDSGGESDAENDDGLAPVTSLFGNRGARTYPKTAADVRQELEDRIPERPETARDARPIDLSTERTARARPGGRRGEGQVAGGSSTAADTAELGLLKKLRARQLSVSEAKTYLGQFELAGEGVEAILDSFLERGYLDDARLAEQVVHAGVDRKGQGRQAISQSLAKRGVPRDIADAALAELPHDDAERALEFARSKAGSMRGLERDVALRRLAGQLARRGYGGSAALGAARQALDESMRPSGRVRFD